MRGVTWNLKAGGSTTYFYACRSASNSVTFAKRSKKKPLNWLYNTMQPTMEEAPPVQDNNVGGSIDPDDPLLIAQTLTYVTDNGSVVMSYSSAPFSMSKSNPRSELDLGGLTWAFRVLCYMLYALLSTFLTMTHPSTRGCSHLFFERAWTLSHSITPCQL